MVNKVLLYCVLSIIVVLRKCTAETVDNVTSAAKLEEIIASVAEIEARTRSVITSAIKTEDKIPPAVQNATDSPKTFKMAEKEITDYINSFLRSLLPKIVSGSSGANISPKCTASMMKVFGNVRNMKGWTLKLLDSMGKPTSGILRGKSYSMGHYDQCLDISVNSRGNEAADVTQEMFRGQYCKVGLNFADVVVRTATDYHEGLVNATGLGKLREFIDIVPYIPFTSDYMRHFFGVCLPSLCTPEDVQQMVQVVSFPGSARVERCESKTETQFDYTQSIIMGILVFLACLVCLGTLIDWLYQHRRCEKGSDPNRCLSIFLSFSVCNNTKRLMSKIVDDESTPERCIRGIFASSVVWVIIGHTYLMPSEAFYEQASSLDNLRQYLTEKTFSFIVTFPLAIDVLFMCYGFLLTYRLWLSSSKKQNVSVNVVRLIIQRYIRLCFPLAFCLGIVFLLPLLGSGPFWTDAVTGTIDKCKDSGWSYVGMFANFLDLEEQCLPHLWFVPCLMQITIIGIFMCWILAKNMKLGVFLLILLSLASNLAVAVLTISYELPPSYVRYFSVKDSNLFWKVNLSLPLSHFGPFAVGMLLGIVTARRIHCHIRPILSLICWVLSIAGLCGLILALHHHRTSPMSSTWSAVYAGNHRTAFSLCVAWVMMACSFGSGGCIGSILSWRVLDPVYRLSYFTYLLHYVILIFVVGSAREQFHYCHVQLIMKALAYICIAYMLSYVCFLMLEMPLRSLQASLCHSRCKEIRVTPVIEATTPKSFHLTNMDSKNSCKLWSVTETRNGEFRVEN